MSGYKQQGHKREALNSRNTPLRFRIVELNDLETREVVCDNTLLYFFALGDCHEDKSFSVTAGRVRSAIDEI